MQVKIMPNGPGAPADKLADAELHFTDGLLAGLKLVGFSVWERRNGPGRTVSLPARHYTVSGERRTFVLLRPTGDTVTTDLIREQVLRAYAEHEARVPAKG